MKAGKTESRDEIDKLREQFSSGMHTVHKVLLLISLVSKFSGGENVTSLQ